MASLTGAMAMLSLGDEQRRPNKRELEESTVGKELDGQEDEEEEEKEISPFRFFDLPTEIRLRIYMFVLFTPRRNQAPRPMGTVGASAKNMPPAPASHRISLFLASRRLHNEATHYFYSTQTFRLFPIQDYSRLPTVRALAPRYRACLKTIELILGSSWTKPPRSWTVNNGLGLKDMVHLRTLKVFIECDPSHPVFRGFRLSKDYYTVFAGDLLRKVLKGLPNLVQVEFDGYPSVQKDGDLMNRLLMETKLANKKILWGPERGWTNYELSHGS